MTRDSQNKRDAGTGTRGVSSPARRFELKPLVAVAAAGAAILAFMLYAGAVMDGELHALDEWILRALREPGNLAEPIGPKWFEEAVRDITALGSTIVLTLAVIVVSVYLWIANAPAKAAFLIVAVTLGSMLNRLLKIGYARPRPDIVAHGTFVSSESFPSGHTTNSTIVYLMLGMMLARVEASYPVKLFIFGVCVAISLMVGLSRIYLGVHWPTDVLAGWAVGAAWVLVCWYVLLRMQPAGTRE
ncbi:phosphatase PAP2 family protein [Hyphomicrobium sp. CS1GBMeth3]|uniref:phosphatase PAP2 family protein n=1 Tax=Hyphomicrobium sp. CS1GBMeth3 TaxID=1892845 RepID=UPI000930C0B8|nr:phosphatase PAP2 family protein [Hyphomicrobium sp. CS1GBMeth3]